MHYQIIDNLQDSSTHGVRLKALFESSERVLVASPFLMADFADFLGDIAISRLRHLHLITTLNPGSFDQIKKISSLFSLIEFPAIREHAIDCKISLNNKLHGKVYIFSRSGAPFSAIITSANFTESGLSRKHEWGIEIFDTAQIRGLEQSLLRTIEYLDISFEEIARLQAQANEYLLNHPAAEDREIDLDLIGSLTSPMQLNQWEAGINFWFKPIGVSVNPVPEDRLFNQLTDRLHFSTIRPTGVKPGDVLIAFGVGTTKMLSVYRAVSFPLEVTEEEIEQNDWYERWPWYVEAENLLPDYGERWMIHSLYKNDLLEEYKAAHPGSPITSVGGQTLGALNYGKDKLKLAPAFAQFIIGKMERLASR